MASYILACVKIMNINLRSSWAQEQLSKRLYKIEIPLASLWIVLAPFSNKSLTRLMDPSWHAYIKGVLKKNQHKINKYGLFQKAYFLGVKRLLNFNNKKKNTLVYVQKWTYFKGKGFSKQYFIFGEYQLRLYFFHKTWWRVLYCLLQIWTEIFFPFFWCSLSRQLIEWFRVI